MQVLIFCVLSELVYILYTLLRKISFFFFLGDIFVVSLEAKIITMNVDGDSITSDIIRGIGLAFEPFKLNSTVTIYDCMPHPYPPEYSTYYIIGILCALSWSFSLLEPYGLRIRHVIMRYYYPHIGKRRTEWLYNKIIFERSKLNREFICYIYAVIFIYLILFYYANIFLINIIIKIF